MACGYIIFNSLTLKSFIMKKLSFQKLSLLGLVLMGASVVTAAVIPSKAKTDNSNKLAKDGTMLDSTTSGSKTCRPKTNADTCFATAGTGTTDGVPGTNGTTTTNDLS